MKSVQVVGAVIMNEKNEVFCAQRSGSMSQPLLWEFPGGKIEEGESAEEALVREIKEELGCKIQVQDKVADIIHEYPNVIVHLITYKAIIIEGVPTLREHAQMKWVPVNQLFTLKWAPADIPTVEKLVSGN